MAGQRGARRLRRYYKPRQVQVRVPSGARVTVYRSPPELEGTDQDSISGMSFLSISDKVRGGTGGAVADVADAPDSSAFATTSLPPSVPSPPV